MTWKLTGRMPRIVFLKVIHAVEMYVVCIVCMKELSGLYDLPIRHRIGGWFHKRCREP